MQNTTTFLDPKLPVKTLNNQIDWIVTQRKQEYVDLLLSSAPSLKKSSRLKIAKGLMALKPIDKQKNIQEWQEKESDREIFVVLQSILERLASGALADETVDAQIYSVDEVIKIIKQKVGDTLYAVEGELGEYKPLPGSQVAYFNLKGAHDDAINCMVMRFVVDRLTFPLNAGMKIRITGQFKIGRNTRMYFQVSRIELTGEGELLRSLQELRAKLEQEGLFDPARKRAIPPYPQRILLIASPNSAALTDFTKVFGQRRGGAILYHLPIKTQGVGAEESVIEGLAQAQKSIEALNIDVVILTRGGGAAEELFVFNSERVVRALFALHAPTVVAIGHERDTTLAELVADLRCSTPSQAAEKSSLSRSELEQQVYNLTNQVRQLVETKYTSYLNVSTQLWLMIVRSLQGYITAIKMQSHESYQYIQSHFARVRYELSTVMKSLVFEWKQRHYQLQCQVPAVKPLLAQYKARLDSVNSSSSETYQTLEAVNPRKVLERGYSIVFAGDKAVGSIKDIEEGDVYQIQLYDGSTEFTAGAITS